MGKQNSFDALATRNTSVTHPTAVQNGRNRSRQDEQVKKKRAMGEVVDVTLNFFGNRQFVAAVDLCPTSEAGNQLMDSL